MVPGYTAYDTEQFTVGPMKKRMCFLNTKDASPIGSIWENLDFMWQILKILSSYEPTVGCLFCTALFVFCMLCMSHIKVKQLQKRLERRQCFLKQC